MNESVLLALFKNTRQVILAEKHCQAQGISVMVLPVPTQVTSDCGMCLKLKTHQVKEFLHLMSTLNLEVTLYEK